MQKHTFPELGISPELLKAIEAQGFEQPSPIQEQAIPVALTGRDVVGQSQTGSGKTIAFGIPVVQRIDPNNRSTQALILCPTRELAMQVCSEIHKLASFTEGVRATPIYGGASYDRQIRGLQQGSQIVVGTPGRIRDFMERGTLRLDQLKMLVFDEADEMLDMGFRDEIDEVVRAVPAERQTIFFSATFDRRIRDLIDRYTRDAKEITIEHKALTVPTIEQRYYEVHGRSKLEVLCRVLDLEAPRLTIVFANTKRAVDDTTDALVARGYAADRLHGDLNQMMRERVMRNFRNASIEVLVATDVAARGLDVNDVDLIVNFELPYDEEDYVHRIGRTGRAGKSGKAVSLVGGREIYLMQRIQRFINARITREKVPSQEEIEATRVDKSFEKLKTALEAGGYASHEHTIQRLLDAGFTATEISSALLDLWLKESSREGEQIMEDRAPKKKEREHREFVPRERPQQSREPRREEPQGAELPAAADRGPEAVPTASEQGQAAESADIPKQSPSASQPPRENFDEDTEDRPRFARSSGPRGVRSDMVRLFINLGGMDGVRPGDIAGMIYNTSQIPAGSVGTIDVLEKCSFLEVPSEHVEAVMKSVTGTEVRGRQVRMDFADRQDGGGDRPRRSFGGPRKFGGGGGGFGPRKHGEGGGGGFGPRKYGEGGGGGFGGGGGDRRPPFKKKFGGPKRDFGGGDRPYFKKRREFED